MLGPDVAGRILVYFLLTRPGLLGLEARAQTESQAPFSAGSVPEM